MTLFLRDEKNNSIVDLEYYVANEGNVPYLELSVSIDIKYYSVLLLSNRDRALQIINDFDNIQELRGWLWEVYFMGGKNDAGKYSDVLKELREMFKDVANRYKLSLVED